MTVGVVPFSVEPSSLLFVYCSLNSTQVQSKTLNFSNNQNTTVPVTITQSWNHTAISLNTSPTTFTLSVSGSQNVTVSITINSSSVGLFSGSLTANTTNYSTTIPISVNSNSCSSAVPSIATVTIKSYSNSSYLVEKQAFTPIQNVTTAGSGWSPSSTVTFDIRFPNSTSVSGYPKNISTSGAGSFTDILSPTGLISGNYTAFANQSSTNSTTTFILRGC